MHLYQNSDPVPLHFPMLLSGGVPVAGLLPEQFSALRTRLQQRFMRIDLATPGLLVQCLDPPIFTVEDLLQPLVCAEIVEASSSTGDF